RRERPDPPRRGARAPRDRAVRAAEVAVDDLGRRDAARRALRPQARERLERRPRHDRRPRRQPRRAREGRHRERERRAAHRQGRADRSRARLRERRRRARQPARARGPRPPRRPDQAAEGGHRRRARRPRVGAVRNGVARDPMRTRDPRLENHGERTVTAARTVALTALALGAACASPGSIGRVDQLARATGARTVLLEEHFSLYSPYDLLRTREYVELVETQRAAVFELFGVQSEEPLVLWLRLDERMGVHASITDDRMRIESVSLETHDGILGEAGDGVVVVRVAPLDVIP